MTAIRTPLLWCLSIFWLIVLSFLPEHPYWRDSGEFLLSAGYLDITHSAGFPLFSQMANGLTLLPFGNLAFKVHLFAIVAAVATLLSAVHIATKLNRTSVALTLLAFFPLYTSQSFLQQAMSAEVYMLHAALLLCCVVLYYYYRETKDLRFILALGFVAGLTLCNHISSLLFLVPGFCLLFRDGRISKRIITCTIFMTLIGLSTYAYLPIRSSTHPPLNTANTQTAFGLLNLFTDARDRDLKAAFLKQDERSFLEKYGSLIQRDLSRFTQAFPLPWLVLGALGLFGIFLRNRRIGALLIVITLSNWYFFLGWDLAPRVPFFAVFGIGACTCFSWLIYSSDSSVVRLLITTILCASSISIPRMTELAAFLEIQASYAEPETVAQDLLDSTAPHGILLTESSWFLSKFERDGHGFRSDVSIVYQPRILFPGYFEPYALTFQNRVVLSNEPFASKPDRYQNRALLQELVQLTSITDTLRVQPNVTINSFLSGVLQLEDIGMARVQHQRPAQYSSALPPQLFTLSRLPLKSGIEALDADAQEHFDTQLVDSSDLLYQSGARELALNLLLTICGSPRDGSCGLVPLSNAAVYLEAAGQQSAADTLRRELRESGLGKAS